jgi:hypothetical protein
VKVLTGVTEADYRGTGTTRRCLATDFAAGCRVNEAGSVAALRGRLGASAVADDGKDKA